MSSSLQHPPPPPPPPSTMAPADHSISATSQFAQQNAALLEQIRQLNSQMKELREERDQLLDHITGVEEKHATFKAMNEDNIKAWHSGKNRKKRAASEKIAGTQHPPECPDMELIGNS